MYIYWKELVIGALVIKRLIRSCVTTNNSVFLKGGGGSNYFRVFHNELLGWVLFTSAYIRLYGTDPFGHWTSYIDFK